MSEAGPNSPRDPRVVAAGKLRRLVLPSMLALVALALASSLLMPARAAELTVTTLADSGPGSLRQALTDATDGDQIRFSVTGTIQVESALVVARDVAVLGPGPDLLGIRAVGAGFPIIDIAAEGDLQLAGLELSQGNHAEGGAIRNRGLLTLHGCRLMNNQAFMGGAVFDAGRGLRITDSSFLGNAASIGLALWHAGERGIVRGSSFIQNVTPPGGIGGAIHNIGNLTLANSTLTENVGGLENGRYLALYNVSIARNGPGGGIDNAFPLPVGAPPRQPVLLINSIVSDNLNGMLGTVVNCLGAVTDGGNNLQFPGIGCGAGIVSADPMLGPAADHGGPSLTLRPAPASPAVDAGNDTSCGLYPVSGIDQRGFARRIDGNGDGSAQCDIGALELDSPGTPTPGFTPPATGTSSPSPSLSSTPTPSASPTLTPSAVHTDADWPPSPTPSITHTPGPGTPSLPTWTPTASHSPSATPTPSITPTGTNSPTVTPSPTASDTPDSGTPNLPTWTPTPTNTATNTASPSVTPSSVATSPTPTPSNTSTPSGMPTRGPGTPASPTRTRTPIPPPSLSPGPPPSSTPGFGTPRIPTWTPRPLPDLEVVDARISQLRRGSGCWRPGEWGQELLHVSIRNRGAGNAGRFSVRADAGQQWFVMGLAAGETLPLPERDGLAGEVQVDADAQVRESNESNNRRPVAIMTFTPPPTCTPGPSPTASPTKPPPSPTASPSPTAIPPGLCLGDLVFVDLGNDGFYRPEDGDYGLAGVRLALYADADASGDLSEGDPAFETQMTRQGGRYRYCGLEPGPYLVAVFADDMRPGGVLEGFASSSGNEIEGRPPDPNDDRDGDDNGATHDADRIASLAIHLEPQSEPPTGLDGDGPNDNASLDLGFSPVAGPAASRVLGFRARLGPLGQVELSWRSLSERGIVGFRLERAPLGSAFTTITPQLIPASGAVDGQAYVYRDTLERTGVYLYRLVVVNPSGPEQLIGPTRLWWPRIRDGRHAVLPLLQPEAWPPAP